jgi:hypothetical protein
MARGDDTFQASLGFFLWRKMGQEAIPDIHNSLCCSNHSNIYNIINQVVSSWQPQSPLFPGRKKKEKKKQSI